jgi:hypothetical protein
VPPPTTLPTAPRHATPDDPPRLRLGPTPPRRSLPWVALGVLLIAGFALTFVVASQHLGQRRAALAVSRSVAAGQPLQAADLQVVHLASDGPVRPIAAADEPSVLGRPAAVPLLAGTLLTSAALGPPATLGPDEAVVAVALKAGQFPTGLAPGMRVLVADTGNPASAAGGPQAGVPAGSALVDSAVVVDLQGPGDTGEATVVSLRLPARDATLVTAANGAERVALVQLPPSRS